MFLIFCSRYDREAMWLHTQLKMSGQMDIEILYQEDLYDCKDWQLQLNNKSCYASVTLPNGKIADTQNVSLFLNRVTYISHPFWQKKDMAEQQYFQQEWNAFLLGWLQAFETALLNKPLPGYLAGYMPLPLRWQMLAKQAGFKIKPQYFSTDNTDILKLQSAVIPANAQSLIVFNYKVFAPIALAPLSEACINLAKATDCKLLEVYVEHDSANQYYFVAANSLTNFSNHPHSFISALKILALNALTSTMEATFAPECCQ